MFGQLLADKVLLIEYQQRRLILCCCGFLGAGLKEKDKWYVRIFKESVKKQIPNG